MIARLIVAVLTVTPVASSHQAQCSSRVASACSASRAGSAAANASPLTATGPGIGFGARLPVSRCCFNHRLIVGTDTRNVPATSDRAVPLVTAATTRSRKSSEYAFTPIA